MPPRGELLHADTLLDISHESLIRNWHRLKLWVNEEVDSKSTYHRLFGRAQDYREERDVLLAEPGLSLAFEWLETNDPTAAWAQRYGGGVIGF